MYQLFQDQQEAIDGIRAAMKRVKFTLLQSPTGSGKTAIGLTMINGVLRQNKRSIFTFPRNTLLDQTSKTLTKFGIPHSYIASGYKFNPFADVFLGMTETMAKWAKKDTLPKDISLLVPDETHFGQNALDTVINHYKKPWLDPKGLSRWTYGVGLSATPWKMNGQGLGIWYDEMVQGKSIRWLIDNKRLSDYRLFGGRRYDQMEAIGRLSDEKAAVAMEAKSEIIGDCVNEYKARALGRLWLTRCTSTKHSALTAQMFRDAGIVAVHVDGDTPQGELDNILKAYARREIWVLTFADLLNFGFDLAQSSGMDVCIEGGSDLKPSGSLSGQLQFWGRLLRYKPFPAIINDHVNNHVKHGLPCQDREWTLDSLTSKARKGAYVLPSKQCPECWFAHPPKPQCPDCGYVYEIEYREVKEVEGSLHEVDINAERASRGMEADGLAALLPPSDDEVEIERYVRYAQREGVKNPYAWAVDELFRRKQKNLFDNSSSGR